MKFAQQVLPLLVMIVIALISGCRAQGPDIPRYRPPVDSSGKRSPSWGDLVWSEANAGAEAIDRLPSLQSTTEDPWLDQMIVRSRTLRNESEQRRELATRSILDAVSRETSPEERAILIADLADLVQTGLPASLEDAATPIIDQAIAEWNDAADAALEAGDLETAWLRFSWVAHAAADGRHPRIELEAMDQARRRADRRLIAGGATSPLPPRVLAYTLRTLLERHVDRPKWRTLTDHGFASLEEEAGSTGSTDVVTRIRQDFESEIRRASDVDAPSSERAEKALLNLGKALQIASTSGAFGSGVDGIRVFLDGMLAATDVRTNVFYGADAAMFKRTLEDSYIGIGVVLRTTPDGLELMPVAGGPARRAGIRNGDVLLAVDGIPAADLGLRGSTEDILGERGSSVRLKVRRGRGADIGAVETVTIVRSPVERETLHGWRQIGVGRDDRPVWDWILEPSCGIAYVAIREFTSETDRSFRFAMRDANRELQATGGAERQVEGLVIDLRANRGGRLGATERLLDLFIPDGSLFEAQDGRGRTNDQTDAHRSNTRLVGLPIVLIIDEDSASAAEMLAGTLQARNDAVVIGERSHGKGSVQTIIVQPDGYLVVTQSWFLIPDRAGGMRLIDRLANEDEWGIRPDIRSAATEEETVEFLEERGDWRSDVGEDQFILEDVPTLETTDDHALLDAVILLKARLLR